MTKQALKDCLKELLIIYIGWGIVLIIGGHPTSTFIIGVLTGVILEARQRYLSICRENGGKLPPRVLDKTDARKIPPSTRTPANNVDKSDICKKPGISATKDDRRDKSSQQLAKMPQQQ